MDIETTFVAQERLIDQFLNFGQPLDGYDDNRAVKFTKDKFGNTFIGEHNADNKLHGRGIRTGKDGLI